MDLASIIGSLISGAIVGAIPAIVGGVRGKIKEGITGFIACVAASFLLGLLLSIPVCAYYMYVIFKKNNNMRNVERDTQFDRGERCKFCPKCGAVQAEEDAFCSKCGNNLL